MTDTDHNSKIVWEYMQLHQDLKPADAIFVLCSLDTRVAERAAELYNQGFGKYVIISGGTGKLTKHLFAKPEAEVFADICKDKGVPVGRLIIESESTNTGENIRFTHDLLQTKQIHFGSFILVQKPYMERRTYATFKKQWPDTTTSIQVTSPKIAFEDYFTAELPKDLVLHIMVGDMHRIREYPKLGYQTYQPIPDEVWRAYESLVVAGYREHLMQA